MFVECVGHVYVGAVIEQDTNNLYAPAVGGEEQRRGAILGCGISIGALLKQGNNLYAWGAPPGQPGWTVPLPDPRAPGRLLGSVQAANRGVAVSGHEGLRLNGPVDPRTGRPAAGDLLAAVAMADSGADADAMSTALFVAGSRAGGQLLSKTQRVEAILLVEGNGEPYLLVSASLAERVRFSPELLDEVGGRVRFILPPQRL